jgi:hypothetical protein
MNWIQQGSTSISIGFQMSLNLGIDDGNSLIIFYCSMICKGPQDSVKKLIFLCLDDGPLPSI